MTDPLWIDAGRDALVGTATIAAATDEFTILGHGLSDGATVTVDNFTGGAVGVLVAGGIYFVRDATVDTFRLAITPSGVPVDLSTDGGADVFRWAPQYSAAELRQAMSGLYQRGDFLGSFAARSGVFPDGSILTGTSFVSISGTTWTVRSHNGVIYTNQGALVGAYLYVILEESGAVDPADATNDRIDALDVQIQDDNVDASGFRRARVVYTPGVPGATPTPPAALPSSVRLAEILVPAGGTPAPSITFVAPITVTRGGVVPTRDSDDYPLQGGRYQGMLLWDAELEALVANLNAGGTWGVIASTRPPQAVPFAATGSFVKANFPGMKAWRFRGWGPGAGGGSAGATSAGEASVGAGGGAGGYVEKWGTPDQLAASQTVTVGTGGAGGAAGDNNSGSAGSSATSLGAICSATSGSGGGGTSGGPGANITPGGIGGDGIGGDFNAEGGYGFSGIRDTGLVMQHGSGGSSPGGGGMTRGTAVTNGGNGITGRFPGGGGSGGHNRASQATARAGGAGADGLAVMEVYF